ncbi:MAG: hypothetical protein IJ187_05825 [Neisseriaceae bacterium]|nr:hypothetical protein [Neisseriaceae bacterium]MBQ9725837.1 hypothetical protein [Neisseriaceae bacterium]
MSQNTQISGKVRSGKARAAKQTPEERKAHAMKMVEAKKRKSLLPKATHNGELKIGNVIINCAVLDNGERVVRENDVFEQFGTPGSELRRIRNEMKESSGMDIPLFLASKSLQPLIKRNFDNGELDLIEYTDSGKEKVGYNATILPKVCEVWLQARDNGLLQKSQEEKVKKIEIFMRGLAHVGIIALVDEATGYQREREKNALAEILEAFVAKELQPYLKTFPPEYYEELFRLWNVPYPPKKPQWRPAYFGKITNNVVYARLAPKLLPELKKESSKIEKSHKLHQLLTSDLGHPKLREHLVSVVSLLKISKTKEEFYGFLDRVHPKFNESYPIIFDDE